MTIHPPNQPRQKNSRKNPISLWFLLPIQGLPWADNRTKGQGSSLTRQGHKGTPIAATTGFLKYHKCHKCHLWSLIDEVQSSSERVLGKQHPDLGDRRSISIFICTEESVPPYHQSISLATCH
jgi:hypothetical protein